MSPLALVVLLFFANFVQTVTGFGMGLIAVPLMVEALGVESATALIALVALFGRIVMIIYYRQTIQLRVVWRLALASAVGIPIGLLGLQEADQTLVLGLLGVVVMSYSVYALGNFRLPEIKDPRWTWVFGVFSGVLSGAYNTGGPPLIIYGTSRRWPPVAFKSNLQGVALTSSILIVTLHGIDGHYTPEVLGNFALVLPVVVLGLFLGLRLDRYLNAALFRRIVLVLLFFIGLNLLV